MNYLAHLYLAGESPESLIGNLLGDFVSGLDPDAIPDRLRAGLTDHRAIDRFTDTHPAVTAARAVLFPHHRHLGRVLLDIYFDHFLARAWDRFATLPLEAFVERVHAVLRHHEHLLVGRLVRAAPKLIEQRWLHAYDSWDGMRAVLNGLSRRTRATLDVEHALTTLRTHYGELERAFERFFPELLAWVESRSDKTPAWRSRPGEHDSPSPATHATP